MAKEAEQKRRLDEGQTLYDVAGMKALFEAAEIVEIDAILPIPDGGFVIPLSLLDDFVRRLRP